MKTNKDYTVEFMNYGKITVPKGTQVNNETAMGKDENYHFVCEYGWIKKNYNEIANILIWDVDHHGIDIPKEFIDNQILV